MGSPRFAIYFVPAAASGLYRFGAAVLGYDCYSGEAVAHQRAGELSEADWAALTAEPRRYGFHATLKAPFRLRSEFTEDDLVAELRDLAASITHYPRFEPTVDLIAGFVAIVPQSRGEAVDRLAADCLTRFDRFRAPLTADEKARRTAAGLSAAQSPIAVVDDAARGEGGEESRVRGRSRACRILDMPPSAARRRGTGRRCGPGAPASAGRARSRGPRRLARMPAAGARGSQRGDRRRGGRSASCESGTRRAHKDSPSARGARLAPHSSRRRCVVPSRPPSAGRGSDQSA